VSISSTSQGNIAINNSISATGGSGNGGSVYLNVSLAAPTAAPNGLSGIIADNRLIDVSTTDGNAGTIRINVANGSLGYVGTTTCCSRLTLSANSPNGTGGNIQVSASGNIATNEWLYRANGTNAGNISVTSGGVFITTGNFQANGSGAGIGGNISVNALNNVSFGYMEASGPAGGGNISVLSQSGSVAVTNQNGGMSLNAQGGLRGGNILVLSANGLSTFNRIDAQGTAGRGGVVSVASTGALANVNIANGVNVNGVTAGGSISLVVPGTLTASTIVAQATAAGSQGGNIYISE
jgi:hypothetical protein